MENTNYDSHTMALMADAYAQGLYCAVGSAFVDGRIKSKDLANLFDLHMGVMLGLMEIATGEKGFADKYNDLFRDTYAAIHESVEQEAGVDIVNHLKKTKEILLKVEEVTR